MSWDRDLTGTELRVPRPTGPYALAVSDATHDAAVRAVLRRVELGALTPAEARDTLAALGLLDVGAGTRTGQWGTRLGPAKPDPEGTR